MNIRPAEARLPRHKTEADRKAERAFWRGLFVGGFGVAILGSIAGWLS